MNVNASIEQFLNNIDEYMGAVAFRDSAELLYLLNTGRLFMKRRKPKDHQ